MGFCVRPATKEPHPRPLPYKERGAPYRVNGCACNTKPISPGSPLLVGEGPGVGFLRERTEMAQGERLSWLYHNPRDTAFPLLDDLPPEVRNDHSHYLLSRCDRRRAPDAARGNDPGPGRAHRRRAR